MPNPPRATPRRTRPFLLKKPLPRKRKKANAKRIRHLPLIKCRSKSLKKAAPSASTIHTDTFAAAILEGRDLGRIRTPPVLYSCGYGDGLGFHRVGWIEGISKDDQG